MVDYFEIRDVITQWLTEAWTDGQKESQLQ